MKNLLVLTLLTSFIFGVEWYNPSQKDCESSSGEYFDGECTLKHYQIKDICEEKDNGRMPTKMDYINFFKECSDKECIESHGFNINKNYWTKDIDPDSDWESDAYVAEMKKGNFWEGRREDLQAVMCIRK